MTFRTFCIYSTASLFIFGWWSLAHIWQKAPSPQQSISIEKLPAKLETLPIQLQLTPLNRQELLKALTGDIQLAIHLVNAWDIDAQILINAGFKGIQRLPRSKVLHANILYRQLCQTSTLQQQKLRQQNRASCVYDDLGTHFNLTETYCHYLPQTYAAASFLLALCDTTSISALPRGIRQQSHLFPLHSLDSIEHDCDRYHSELLQTAPPDIAFTADYSHPAFLTALKDQGIPSFNLCGPESLAQISANWLRLGHLVNRAPEAIIFTTLWEASFLALDNHVLIASPNNSTPQRPLFLFHYQNTWHMPTQRNLSSQLLKRLNLSPLSSIFCDTKDWLTPLTLEQLILYDPDHLIIATDDKIEPLKMLQISPLSQLSACRLHQCYFVEAVIQESVAQHTALAYFDLCQTLLQR